jgi:hypothetical protein
MLARLVREERRFAPLAAAMVVLLSALVVREPRLALAVVGLVALVALALLPPLYLLAGVVALTAIVPYGVQKSFGVGGGTGSPGLLPSDVLLVAALLRAGPQLLRLRLTPRVRLCGLLVAAFVTLSALQFVRGAALGHDFSTAGYELRVLLGFATFIVTLPILADESQRAGFLKLLPVIGLLVGLWGLAQWLFNIQFSAAGDAGILSGVQLTTAGRGHLRGGLFSFPVVLLVTWAVLISGSIRSVRTRALLFAVLVLNFACVLLTYERTLWVATVLAAAVVVFKAGSAQRFRAVVWGSVLLIVVFAAIATLAPSELIAARERLLSLNQHATDTSVLYRVAETQVVAHQIRVSPLVGSGLGASIFWGQPWDQVPPTPETYAHNGYLWLAWKLGVPIAALLWALLFLAIGLSKRATGSDAFEAVQNGCRAAILALAVIAVTLSVFNELGISATMGMLFAVALWPRGMKREPLAPRAAVVALGTRDRA